MTRMNSSFGSCNMWVWYGVWSNFRGLVQSLPIFTIDDMMCCCCPLAIFWRGTPEPTIVPKLLGPREGDGAASIGDDVCMSICRTHIRKRKEVRIDFLSGNIYIWVVVRSGSDFKILFKFCLRWLEQYRMLIQLFRSERHDFARWTKKCYYNNIIVSYWFLTSSCVAVGEPRRPNSAEPTEQYSGLRPKQGYRTILVPT